MMAMIVIFIQTKRLSKITIILKPSTLLKIHKSFVQKKYSKLFSNKNPKKPGRKSPSEEIINLVLAFKIRNPKFGYMRIAMQIKNQFNIDINSDVVRRILNKHYKPTIDDNNGPSWLTFLGHSKDSLWSLDLFRCESISSIFQFKNESQMSLSRACPIFCVNDI